MRRTRIAKLIKADILTEVEDPASLRQPLDFALKRVYGTLSARLNDKKLEEMANVAQVIGYGYIGDDDRGISYFAFSSYEQQDELWEELRKRVASRNGSPLIARIPAGEEAWTPIDHEKLQREGKDEKPNVAIYLNKLEPIDIAAEKYGVTSSRIAEQVMYGGMKFTLAEYLSGGSPTGVVQGTDGSFFEPRKRLTGWKRIENGQEVKFADHAGTKYMIVNRG